MGLSHDESDKPDSDGYSPATGDDLIEATTSVHGRTLDIDLTNGDSKEYLVDRLTRVAKEVEDQVELLMKISSETGSRTSTTQRILKTTSATLALLSNCLSGADVTIAEAAREELRNALTRFQAAIEPTIVSMRYFDEDLQKSKYISAYRSNTDSHDRVRVHARKLAAEADNLSGSLTAVYQDGVSPQPENTLDQFLLLAGRTAALTLGLTKQDAVRGVEQIYQSADAAKSAVGLAGVASLADIFHKYANEQRDQATSWIVLTWFVVSGLVGWGVWFLYRGQAAQFTVPELVAHALITLPVLGAAAYSARESSRHREASQWGRQLAAQLQTITAYVDPLPTELKSALLARFGEYVFGPHSPGRVDNQLHTIPPEVLQSVSDAATVLKNLKS